MNIITLKTFLTIIETGSLVRASEALNVTQSTVTARLQSLESELGQTLINRSKSGITLTDAGKRLRKYAETISNLWRQARNETALPAALNTICNIACEPELWPELGEKLFDHLSVSHPKIALSISIGNQASISKWLATGRCDVAITYGPAIGPNQKRTGLAPDRLILVSSTSNGSIRSDPHYVFVEAGEEYARDHAAAYADAGVARLTFSNATLGLQHLLKFGGSAYLPRRLALSDIENGHLFQLTDAPEFNRDIYLSYNSTVCETWEWFESAVSQTLT